MAEATGRQIEALQQTIASLEAQRITLGNAVVTAALAPLREKLAELEAQQAQQAAEVERQRKQVTTLFMDVVGSTQLVSGMDPEEAMDVFDSALKHLGGVVEAHGGRVTRYMGDGLLAVFGVPVAREDDPQRAVYAGLALVEEAKQAGEILGTADLAVRVGVNTGLVAVGGQTEAEDTLMGRAVNLAARLESAAPAGGVLISHETYRHVRGVFDIQENEPVIAKGFAEPVRAYRVLNAKARAFRQPLRGVEGLETRMVGREAELKCLQDGLTNALETGEGQVITVSGEAGVGKSRLLEEFQAWAELRPERMMLYRGRGRIEGQGLPYGLLREVFADRFGILENDDPEAARAKLVQGLQQGWQEQAEMKAHILGQLLGYDFRESVHLQGVSDGAQLRNRGMMYLGEYFAEMSRRRPVVMLLEDIHWADDSTLDAADWLAERMDKLRMVIVCAGRESLFERRPYWGEGGERHTRVTLKPLTKRESRELVEEILRHVTQLPEDLRELIVENAEGNPFYLEELIKMLIDDGVIVKGETEWRVEPEQLQVTSVPSTLTGVLQARLDGLPEGERRVLQEASVVGRQFWDRLVAYVHSGGRLQAMPGLLHERLSSLRGRELIFHRESSAFAEAQEYLFKHDLLREVTYESVLRKVRQAHHALVADWLIANAGGRISEYAGLIGEHLVLGGRGAEAVDYLLQAGMAALAAYSSREAERFCRRALALRLSEAQQATALQGLGRALYTQGKRDEAIAALQQAIQLARRAGNTDQLAQIVAGLSWVQWRAELQDTSESWLFCQQAVEELKTAPDSPGLARLLAEAGRAAHFAHQPRAVTASYCRRAMDMAERLGLLDVQLTAGITLGLVDPNIEECIRAYDQIASRAEAHGLLEIASRAYFNLATMKGLTNDRAAARECRRKSLDLSCRMGDIPGVLFCLSALAEMYLNDGMLSDVPSLMEQTLDRVGISEQRASQSKEEIAMRLLFYQGDLPEVIRLRRLRLDEAHRRGDRQAVINNSGWMIAAHIHLYDLTAQGNLAEAEAIAREVLALIQQDRSLGFSVFGQLDLAQILAGQGRLAEARHSLTEAEALLENGHLPAYQAEGAHEQHAQARYTLARAKGHWDEALDIAQAFADRFAAGGSSWPRARWLVAVADILHSRDAPGDQEHACRAYQQALDLFAAMGADGFARIAQQRLAPWAAEWAWEPDE